jgi:hypothetical protein
MVSASPFELVSRTLFLFFLALLFAALEVEIEGKNGWAAGLPTWFRLRPPIARLYGRIMGGKPLTGYHAVMFVLPPVCFHFPYFAGAPWTPAAEALTIAEYAAWVSVWDFWWFLLNPAFGWKRFRPENVWWHKRWVARMPIDYYRAFVAAFAIALGARWLVGDFRVLVQIAIEASGMVLLTLIVFPLAPLYRRWYLFMRRPGSDERALLLPGPD